jgi:hypothetical protein
MALSEIRKHCSGQIQLEGSGLEAGGPTGRRKPRHDGRTGYYARDLATLRCVYDKAGFESLKLYDSLMLNVGNGWVAGGCWDDDITSDEMDHSQKFPAFSTSKMKLANHRNQVKFPSQCQVKKIMVLMLHTVDHQFSRVKRLK